MPRWASGRSRPSEPLHPRRRASPRRPSRRRRSRRTGHGSASGETGEGRARALLSRVRFAFFLFVLFFLDGLTPPLGPAPNPLRGGSSPVSGSPSSSASMRVPLVRVLFAFGSGKQKLPGVRARGDRERVRLPSFFSLPVTSRRQGRSFPPWAGRAPPGLREDFGGFSASGRKARSSLPVLSASHEHPYDS